MFRIQEVNIVAKFVHVDAVDEIDPFISQNYLAFSPVEIAALY